MHYTGKSHIEPPEVGIVEILSGSLYWWVELGVPSYIESATALSDRSNVKIYV